MCWNCVCSVWEKEKYTGQPASESWIDALSQSKAGTVLNIIRSPCMQKLLLRSRANGLATRCPAPPPSMGGFPVLEVTRMVTPLALRRRPHAQDWRQSVVPFAHPRMFAQLVDEALVELPGVFWGRWRRNCSVQLRVLSRCFRRAVDRSL